MERIEVKGNVKKVVPKHGRGNTIELSVEVPFSQDALLRLADCMMNSDDLAEITLEYDPTPLFDEDEDESGELFDSEGE